MHVVLYKYTEAKINRHRELLQVVYDNNYIIIN
jgi:hypothetical protein